MDVLAPYLRRALSGGGESSDLPVSVEQFPGGHSNLTYLVRVGDREAVLRRPPFGSKVKSAHDMTREYRVLSRLAPVYPRVPKPIALCEDESILGAKFYLMERLQGVVVRRDLPEGLSIDEGTMRRLSRALIDTLVELHAIDYVAAGLGDFGNPEGFVERQVKGWTKRYADSQTDEIEDMAVAAKWMAENVRPSGAASIVHNDYKFDNLVLDPNDLTNVVGILDWELSTIGDPLMDLGTALCYWVEAADPFQIDMLKGGVTTRPGALTRRELAERYAERSGRDTKDIVSYYAFGLFKTAVVLQQIYYRYKQGLTKDPRFGPLIHAVRALAAQAVASMGRSRL